MTEGQQLPSAPQVKWTGMNLQSLLDQIGVEGVRLLSCWVHPEGFFRIVFTCLSKTFSQSLAQTYHSTILGYLTSSSGC